MEGEAVATIVTPHALGDVAVDGEPEAEAEESANGEGKAKE